jgi:hypothetical protein
MVEVAQSYEMVCNFNNFKAFVMVVCFCFVLQIFLTSPPDNIFGKNLYDLVKILGNVGQNMTTPPPPPMLMASRRPCPCLTCFSCCTLTPPPILSPHLLVIVSSTVLQSTPLGRVLDRKFKCHSGQILKGGTFLQRRLESLPKSLRKIVMS